jgi:hypothetical protein
MQMVDSGLAPSTKKNRIGAFTSAASLLCLTLGASSLAPKVFN